MDQKTAPLLWYIQQKWRLHVCYEIFLAIKFSSDTLLSIFIFFFFVDLGINSFMKEVPII